MSKVKKVYVAILACCLLVALASRLGAAPAAAIKVDGRVLLGEKVTHLTMHVYRLGAPLTGLKVMVAGRLVEELGSGMYNLLLQEPLGSPGKPLPVTIEMPVVSGQPVEKITATIRVAPWIRITAPADETHAGVNGPAVVVVWSGGSAPFRLTARPEEQPGTYAFDESGITANRKAIPMSHFQKGKRYLVNVGFEAGDFTFDAPLERGSRLALIERSTPLHLNVD
jgi:hypothetical protein